MDAAVEDDKQHRILDSRDCVFGPEIQEMCRALMQVEWRDGGGKRGPRCLVNQGNQSKEI